MATLSTILAWKIPWTEEPGGLHSMEFQKSWTRLSNFTKGQIRVKKMELRNGCTCLQGSDGDVDIKGLWTQQKGRRRGWDKRRKQHGGICTTKREIDGRWEFAV